MRNLIGDLKFLVLTDESVVRVMDLVDRILRGSNIDRKNYIFVTKFNKFIILCNIFCYRP